MLVFLHGTAIMHPGGIGRTREERVAQARTRADPALHDYAAYVPVDGAVAKLRRWREQGAEITYLSSHRNPGDVAKDAFVLQKYRFPEGRVLARTAGESYGDVAGRELPDVLIEDDCESLDGGNEITYAQIPPGLRARIRSIIVPEFGGIDHLPDSLEKLLVGADSDPSERQPEAFSRTGASSASSTKRAPFIDFTTATTSQSCTDSRQTSRASPSVSVGTAPRSTSAPSTARAWKSNLARRCASPLRSFSLRGTRPSGSCLMAPTGLR